MTGNRNLKTLLISMILGAIAMSSFSKLKVFLAQDQTSKDKKSPVMTCYLADVMSSEDNRKYEEVLDAISKLQNLYEQKKISKRTYLKRLEKLEAEKAVIEKEMSKNIQKSIGNISEEKEKNLYHNVTEDPKEFEAIQKEIDDSDNPQDK